MFDAAFEGRVKGMYTFGENPLLGDPNVHHVRKALGNLDFLVVQDIFPTEVGEMANMVLPGASFAETGGTFTQTPECDVCSLRIEKMPQDAQAEERAEAEKGSA